MAETLRYVGEIMPFLLQGTLIMIELFVLTLLFSLPLGLPVTLGSTCRFKVVRFICKCFIWIFRGTPLLLQLFFFFYMDPLDDNSTVTVHINRLRQKIEEDPSNPQYILTVWGSGYKFSI